METTAVRASREVYVRNGTHTRVELVSEVSGVVVFFPKGGGLQYRMPADKFHTDHTLETGSPPFTAFLFGIDGAQVLVPGFSRPDMRWNGWAMPCFTKTAADLLCTVMPDVKYNAGNDSYDTEVDGELDQFGSEAIDVPGIGQVTVYAIGSGSWCWDRWDIGEDIGDMRVLGTDEGQRLSVRVGNDDIPGTVIGQDEKDGKPIVKYIGSHRLADGTFSVPSTRWAWMNQITPRIDPDEMAEPVPTGLEYTGKTLERYRGYHQVTHSGVVYDQELAGPGGMGYVLLREPHTTDAMLKEAVAQLRRDYDVVGKIKVTKVIPLN